MCALPRSGGEKNPQRFLVGRSNTENSLQNVPLRIGGPFGDMVGPQAGQQRRDDRCSPRRGQDERHLRWRLFQELEHRVPSRILELVRLLDDDDLGSPGG
jgi:hypothetical protein